MTRVWIIWAPRNNRRRKGLYSPNKCGHTRSWNCRLEGLTKNLITGILRPNEDSNQEWQSPNPLCGLSNKYHLPGGYWNARCNIYVEGSGAILFPSFSHVLPMFGVDGEFFPSQSVVIFPHLFRVYGSPEPRRGFFAVSCVAFRRHSFRGLCTIVLRSENRPFRP